MVRNSTHAVGARKTAFAVRLALAAVLAGGIAVGAAAPAFAKDKPEAPAGKQPNSKAFADAYKPLATIVNAPNGDYAAAKAQLPTLTAAIQNNTDRMVAGQLILVLGNKLNDRSLQLQGLQTMLQSGQVEPAKLGQVNYLIGGLEFDAKDYANALTALKAAVAAGYTQDDPRPLIAESYFGSGQSAQGLQYLADAVKQNKAAGQPVPTNWLERGLKVAYDAKLVPQANDYAAMLVENAPTAKSWTEALQVVDALNQLDPKGQLDVLRLMRLTGALSDKHEYTAYIADADPRRMSNEVLGVLDEGVKSGVLTPSDSVYKEAKPIADARAAGDKAAAASVEADARKSSDGQIAMGAGDDYYSFGAFDKAAQMYQLAVDKGVSDRNLALLQLGIAQAQAGQYAAAKAAFAQVTGPRAPVARMWLAYVATKTAA